MSRTVEETDTPSLERRALERRAFLRIGAVTCISSALAGCGRFLSGLTGTLVNRIGDFAPLIEGEAVTKATKEGVQRGHVRLEALKSDSGTELQYTIENKTLAGKPVIIYFFSGLRDWTSHILSFLLPYHMRNSYVLGVTDNLSHYLGLLEKMRKYQHIKTVNVPVIIDDNLSHPVFRAYYNPYRNCSSGDCPPWSLLVVVGSNGKIAYQQEHIKDFNKKKLDHILKTAH